MRERVGMPPLGNDTHVVRRPKRALERNLVPLLAKTST